MYNAKQQLIVLLEAGANYRMLWLYLKWLQEHDIINEKITLNHCQFICHQICLENQQLKPIHLKPIQAPDLYLNACMLGEPSYPQLWLQLPKPPIIFFFQGNLAMLQKPMVSIIGTRKITPYGRSIAREFSRKLVELGWVTVSGLALGVDSQVHQASITTGRQSTVAILPTGFNQFYPRQHMDLQQAIGRQHLLISEFLPDASVKKYHFLMRNRLVAGLSPATIVIEAANQSGSLITANYALQFNRDLFVLPGRITDEQSAGCLKLIDLGARPILSVEETLEDLQELYFQQGYLKTK